MKKIMKKALSLVLALVMVFTLAPMSANAAEGDTVPVPSWEYCISSGDQVTVGAHETIYFEIGGGPLGTYDFVVTGDGAFDVAVCTEDGEGAYKAGASIAATNGTVETEITLYESTYNYCAFSITNNTESEATYECTIVFPEGTQANPKPITLALGGSATVTVPAESEYYIAATLPQPQVEYALTITGQTGFGYSGGYGMPAPDTNGKYETTIAAWYGAATFAIVNKTTSEQTYTISIAELPLGSEAKPDEFVVDTTITKELDGAAYWYEWLPTEAGKLTFTVDEDVCTEGWVVTVINDYTGVTVQKSSVWEDAAEFEVTFDSYENIKVSVSVPGIDAWNELSAYEYGTGTVEFSTVLGANTGSGEGGEGGEGSEGGEEVVGGEEINENYFYNYTELGVGTTSIMPAFGYPTTLYTFRADEAGTYTITLSDTEGKVGYYGSNEWFPYDYSEDTGVANTYTYTLNYTEADAPALIGVSDTMMCDITITRTGDVQEEDEIEKEAWTLAVSPEAYVFDGDEKDLQQLIYGMADGKVIYVMDENGYFHVAPIEDVEDDETSIFGYSYVGDKNIEELPYVLVDLSDKVVSLQAALAERDFLVAVYDEETGEPTGIVDFTAALKELLACADKETGLYPLTYDLFLVFSVGGEAQGWYMNTESTTGIVAAEYPETDGIDPAFLHAFAMYYLDQDITTLDKEKPVVEKDAMTDIINTNKDKDTVISTTTTNADGEEVEVKFTFEAGTMKPVEGKEDYSFKVELVEDHDKATADKAEIEKDTFVIRINFEYDGQLPAKATITIPVPVAYANKTLYYYQILEDGTLKYVCDAPVDANGNAKVTQDHCSDYVLLAEKIVEDTVAPGGTTTGDSTNFALWIAVLGLGIAAIAGSVVMRKREF